MTDCGLESSVPDWVIDHRETLAVFRELGIDYSCGGKSLEFACRDQRPDERHALSLLYQCIEDSRPDETGTSSQT